MPDKIKFDFFFPEAKLFFAPVNLFNHIHLLKDVFYVHSPCTATKPKSSFNIISWMDSSLCDQWMTSNFTPNKYEVFISVTRAFTIISASEMLLLLHIYVWYRQKGVAGTCAYSYVCMQGNS